MSENVIDAVLEDLKSDPDKVGVVIGYLAYLLDCGLSYTTTVSSLVDELRRLEDDMGS